MKIALVHEWFTTYAGSEKVLETILGEFPEADVFSLIDHLPSEHRAGLLGKTVQTTYLQRIPFISSMYKYSLWRSCPSRSSSSICRVTMS